MPSDDSLGPRDAASVLVVCTGNVCRSPFVERYLAHRLNPADVVVSSAGTAALVGAPMDARVATKLAKLGGTCDGFVARQLTPGMVERSDLVLVATREHRAQVVTLAPRALRYCFTVRDFAALVRDRSADEEGCLAGPARLKGVVLAASARRGFIPPLSDREADIVDPYRQADEVYEQMQQQIQAAMPPIIAALAS